MFRYFHYFCAKIYEIFLINYLKVLKFGLICINPNIQKKTIRFPNKLY